MKADNDNFMFILINPDLFSEVLRKEVQLKTL